MQGNILVATVYLVNKDIDNILIFFISMISIFIAFLYFDDFVQAQHRKYLDSLIERRYVKSHKRKNGKYVKGYYRRKYK
ncbi:hypothetical protein WA1_19720 [Scytonema hofmannii PCC 7110]|uniref:Uncharacterized protein n=1 Tax=Scytonema hofmannii PCC 7110 TaxID=128403 RepID=A0A139XC36_9CYAN|nr:hypothetical protein WA1_19720 [Scytonema hofmannii PCC 7110]